MYADFPDDTPVVQKYGGTSVGSPERIKAVAARIARQVRAGRRKLAVVVSARSGVTNRLVERVHEVNPRASGLAYDMALAAGEQETVGLLTAALEAEGIHAAPFLAFQIGILTDTLHTKARIRKIHTERIEEAWRAHPEGAVCVVPGFQGINDDLQITTLGRGGSDTSAVALAVALKAGFCEINTDVDGVYTADPRHVKGARLIERMDFETALEMASLGSKVLHARCVELSAKYRLPLVVRNSFKPDEHVRTCIMPHPSQAAEKDAIESLVVSGVTTDRDVARITLTGLPKDAEAITRVFDKMAEEGVNVDIIIHNKLDDEPTTRLAFTVGTGDLSRVKSGIEQLVEQAEFGELKVETETGLAKVSVVGVGMKSYSGVAGRTFKALTARGIDIQMISTSEIKISCVVDGEAADEAAQALHDEFVQ